jgi:glycosyltransferase involved in cell wall biosynthesis
VTPRPWGPGKTRVLQTDPSASAFHYRGKFGWRSFKGFGARARTVGKGCDRIWVIGTCASCLSAGWLTGRKVLLSHHYHHFENKASRLRWTAFYLAFGPGLDAITYPTEFTRNEALSIAPWLKGKTHVVRHGFNIHYSNEEQRLADKRAARAELQMPQDGLLIGNGGWLIPRKRFDIFLRTAALVSRKIPGARFYICGGGPEEGRLRKLACELGISDKVHFLGWVQDMSPYYRAWDILLFNTDFDAFGCTPPEAASYGCLCVASCTYGGLSEFLQDGQTGFLLDQHDPDNLAVLITRLAQDSALALRLRRQAIHMLDEKFNHEMALKFYENYFTSHLES